MSTTITSAISHGSAGGIQANNSSTSERQPAVDGDGKPILGKDGKPTTVDSDGNIFDSSGKFIGRKQEEVPTKPTGQSETATKAQRDNLVKGALSTQVPGTTPTPAPTQAQIEGAGLTPNILPKGTPATDPKTNDFPGATLPPTTKTGEAVSHTQTTSDNTAFQSAHTIPTGEAAQAQFKNDTETISDKYGYKQLPSQTDTGTSGAQANQGNTGLNSGSYANQNQPPLNITNIGSNNTTIMDNGNVGGFIQGGGSNEAHSIEKLKDQVWGEIGDGAK